MDAAELSGLSAQGIYPKGDDAQGVGVGGYRGDGARFAYSGWSCFGKQLAKAPKGWPAPMVMTWSNPVQIRLTDEGKMLGAWMHAAAETRGDCACGLMSAEDVARAEAERRRIVFGAAEPDDDDAEEEGCDRDRDRDRERAPSSPARRREAEDAETGKALAGEKKKERRDETDAAALRRERARAATLEEIARIRASARGEAPSAAFSGAGEDARTPPRARAAAAAEKRRSADGRAPAPAPAPSDDDVVVLDDDDDDEADARDLPPFVSSSGRRRSPPDERDARRFEPSVGVEMFDPRASSSPRGGDATRARAATGAATRRAPRLPPISAGKTFADEYEVVLVVDNREQFGGGRRAAGQSRSEHRLEEVRRIAAAHGIAAEVGHLECGDATWVARRRRGTHVAGAADDYVLDFAVERKSLEDLKLSIQDDRYRQQKFFLKKSGLRNLGYLVEGDVARFADRPDVSEQSAKAVGSAAVQTEVWDGFSVIRTEDVKETFDVLARMTLAMRERFARMRAEDGAAARPPERRRGGRSPRAADSDGVQREFGRREAVPEHAQERVGLDADVDHGAGPGVRAGDHRPLPHAGRLERRVHKRRVRRGGGVASRVHARVGEPNRRPGGEQTRVRDVVRARTHAARVRRETAARYLRSRAVRFRWFST
jgi:crossover junction endonuclease MUS81